MSREVDARIQRFTEVLDRLPGGSDARAVHGRRIKRAVSNAGRRLRRGLIAVAVLLAGLLAYYLFLGTIGIGGFLLVALLIPLLFIIAASLPLGGDIQPEALKKATPAVLPAQADRWLDSRRAELPRLAAPTLDKISAQLNAIGPQLATLPAMDPLAQDVSRLLNKHLPELVERYTKVPTSMRTQPDSDGGPSIERRLVDGLKTVEGELARVSDTLSRDDRDAFLVKGQFLEDRYKADGGVVK